MYWYTIYDKPFVKIKISFHCIDFLSLLQLCSKCTKRLKSKPTKKKMRIWRKFGKMAYVTAGMDISAASVPPGPNLTGGMEPGINTNI